MSRRPSVVSLSSIGSGSGFLKPIQLPTLSESGSRGARSFSNGSAHPPTRTVSLNINLDAIKEKGADNWDPDDLFTKHTVAEVKAIQQRLRNDADAKQEELRLMVGERYRDLLQASTSIISIAQSSDNVLGALDELRSVTTGINPREGAEASTGGQGDEHLQSLQSLAAHMKLLLDAPEHLWRFMERKLYLHAAWLFLLSRVVHQSLLREDDDEDQTWYSLGIRILEQFPLVQRQWDAVSHFRSQISHKATMALRESSSTSPEVCATLLTLYLLESRPLPETLATLLSQRTRSLTTSLSRPKERIANGSAVDSPASNSQKSRKTVTREVRQRLKTVLDIVIRTLSTSRTLFLRSSDEAPPLMYNVLRHIQGDAGTPDVSLPTEVRLSSQTLLSSLPSSNHFLLLPTNIRSYRPYVDDSSLTTVSQHATFETKLSDWFKESLAKIRLAVETWFAELNTIRELWETRTWCRNWIRSTDGLNSSEIAELGSMLDAVGQQQAAKIWKTALSAAETTFQERLTSALDNLGSSSDSLDAQPVQYLFQAPPMPSASHIAAGTSASSATFQTFKKHLHRQIIGRTPLVDDVLATLEKNVQALRDDLDTMKGEDDDTRTLASRLMEEYRSDAHELCRSLCSALQSSLDRIDEGDTRTTILLGRIADHISSSNVLMDCIGCSADSRADFCSQLTSLYDETLRRWMRCTVSGAFAHWPPVYINEQASVDGTLLTPKPSSHLLDGLLSLSGAIQEVGVHIDAARLGHLTRQILHQFTVAVLERLRISAPQGTTVGVTSDLTFLQLLAESWGADAQATQDLLKGALSHCDQTSASSIRGIAEESLSRMQILLGVLLPPVIPSKSDHEKGSSLLHKGLPTMDAQYQPAFELVKPSVRFGLLLVGSSVGR